MNSRLSTIEQKLAALNQKQEAIQNEIAESKAEVARAEKFNTIYRKLVKENKDSLDQMRTSGFTTVALTLAANGKTAKVVLTPEEFVFKKGDKGKASHLSIGSSGFLLKSESRALEIREEGIFSYEMNPEADAEPFRLRFTRDEDE